MKTLNFVLGKKARFSIKLIATSILLATITPNLPVWGQSGNQSDITGADIVETGTGVFQPSREIGEGAAFEFDQQAVDELISNPLNSAGETYTLQTQSILSSYVPLFQLLDLSLEEDEVVPETIASTLALLLEITGNKANYVQVSLTEDGQVIITRIPPTPVNPNASIRDLKPGDPLLSVKSLLDKVLNRQPFESIWGTNHSGVNAQNTETDAIVFQYRVPGLEGERTQRLIKQLRSEIQDSGSLSKAIGQRLYQMLIEPMEADLEANQVDTIVFSLDSDLLGLPLQALYDGQQFLLEKYAVSVVPSFGLTDIGYEDIRERSILAMGSETFADQNPLPSVPVELESIQFNDWQGRSLLNDQFTVENFIQTFQNITNAGQRPGIIHLATHGEFAPRDYLKSYIQFSDRRVSLQEFRQISLQLGWNLAATAPELLVLSACRTAVGDPIAELGFGGLAVASGAKTALASLWYVSDVGTLALMSEFYDALHLNPIKVQALQNAQLNLLQGSTQLRSGQLVLSNGRVIDLPDSLAQLPDQDFRDPYYWSSFTLIGNWN